MSGKQTTINRMSMGWPLLHMPEKGMDRLVDGFAVYRNLMAGMSGGIFFNPGGRQPPVPEIAHPGKGKHGVGEFDG